VGLTGLESARIVSGKLPEAAARCKSAALGAWLDRCPVGLDDNTRQVIAAMLIED